MCIAFTFILFRFILKVKNAKYLGSNICSAFVKSAARIPEQLGSLQWSVSTGESTWLNCTLSIGPLRKNLFVQGVSGPYEYCNGLYIPSDMPSIAPIFEKDDRTDIFLRYNEGIWEIINSQLCVLLKTGYARRFSFSRDAPSVISSNLSWYGKTPCNKYEYLKEISVTSADHPKFISVVSGYRLSWANKHPILALFGLQDDSTKLVRRISASSFSTPHKSSPQASESSSASSSRKRLSFSSSL